MIIFHRNECFGRRWNVSIPVIVFEHTLMWQPASPHLQDPKEWDQFLSGSMAEFSEDEPFSTIGDVDIMLIHTSTLAIFEDFNIKLIKTYKHCFYPKNTILRIVPYQDYPGYVKILDSCEFVFTRDKFASGVYEVENFLPTNAT